MICDQSELGRSPVCGLLEGWKSRQRFWMEVVSRVDKLLGEAAELIGELRGTFQGSDSPDDGFDSQGIDEHVEAQFEAVRRSISGLNLFQGNCDQMSAHFLQQRETLRKVLLLGNKLSDVSAEVERMELQLHESMQASAREYERNSSVMASQREAEIERVEGIRKNLLFEYQSKATQMKESHHKIMTGIEDQWLERKRIIEKKRSHDFCAVKLSQQEKRYQQKFVRLDSEISVTVSKCRKLRKLQKDLKKKKEALRNQLRKQKLRDAEKIEGGSLPTFADLPDDSNDFIGPSPLPWTQEDDESQRVDSIPEREPKTETVVEEKRRRLFLCDEVEPDGLLSQQAETGKPAKRRPTARVVELEGRYLEELKETVKRYSKQKSQSAGPVREEDRGA